MIYYKFQIIIRAAFLFFFIKKKTSAFKKRVEVGLKHDNYMSLLFRKYVFFIGYLLLFTSIFVIDVKNIIVNIC